MIDCTANSNGLSGGGNGIIIKHVTGPVLVSGTVTNGDTAVEFNSLGGSGPFYAKCNDIAGNAGGMYLSNAVTVDARWVWWGNITGPSAQGPGAGDGIWADPGGEILHSPWLEQSYTFALSLCDFFNSSFEAGSFGEWDVVME